MYGQTQRIEDTIHLCCIQCTRVSRMYHWRAVTPHSQLVCHVNALPRFQILIPHVISSLVVSVEAIAQLKSFIYIQSCHETYTTPELQSCKSRKHVSTNFVLPLPAPQCPDPLPDNPRKARRATSYAGLPSSENKRWLDRMAFPSLVAAMRRTPLPVHSPYRGARADDYSSHTL